MGEKTKKMNKGLYNYHHWDKCLSRFLFYYTLLTGHRVVDYGWDKDPYADRERSL